MRLSTQVQLLHQQLLQLSLDNALLQLRGQVLEQLCACTLGLLYVLHKHGPRLEGAPHPTVCSSTNTGLGQLETHIRAMLLGMGGTTLLPQGLPPPSLHVTSTPCQRHHVCKCHGRGLYERGGICPQQRCP